MSLFASNSFRTETTSTYVRYTARCFLGGGGGEKKFRHSHQLDSLRPPDGTLHAAVRAALIEIGAEKNMIPKTTPSTDGDCDAVGINVLYEGLGSLAWAS